ncbi:MAG: hypothetical protein KC636_27320, partial [Myxococcales bacterium]|nr:hypothetical protein [Myxococcales bacterium]
ERSDQFSLCVALYEALYRELPFAGATYHEREQAVVRGRLRGPPKGTRVPTWMRLVLLRGLANQPEQRYPSVAALLDALTRDPEALRRRRLRTLGALLAMATASALVIFGATRVWEGWQERARERAALERLMTLERHVDALLTAGEADEAAQAFAAFVEQPENRGTRALGLAWLHAAERAMARGDARAGLDAYAASYTLSTFAGHQQAALIGLARYFRERDRDDSLARAVQTLDGVVEEAGDRKLSELRFDAALARRDLAGALALLEGPLQGSERAASAPLLRALLPATSTEHAEAYALALTDLDGEGADELLLSTLTGQKIVARAPELTARRVASPSRKQILAVPPAPGEPARFIDNVHTDMGERDGTVALARLSGDGLVDELRWREHPALSLLARDLDRDGERELYVGTGPYSRRLLRLDRAVDGRWRMSSPAPALDRRGSDVRALAAGDLDDDGREELVVGLGPWTAYEVSVLRHDPARGQLVPVARRKLGNIQNVAIVRRGPGPPEIAAYKSDDYPNVSVFPVERPYGEPAGVYLFRLFDDALEQTLFIPDRASPDPDWERLARHFVVGDLDGDGRDELIAHWLLEDRTGREIFNQTAIYTTTADGSVHTLKLAYARPVGAVDLDGDGDDELVVMLQNPGEDRLWVLGAGAS